MQTKTNSNIEPQKLTIYSNGTVIFRWDIVHTQTEEPSPDGGAPVVRDSYDYYEVWVRNAADNPEKVVEEVLKSHYGNDTELKLINDYNAAVLGVLSAKDSTAAIKAYKDYLTERQSIKQGITEEFDKLK